MRATVLVQVLILPACEDGVQTADAVAEMVREYAPRATFERIEVETPEDAERLAFPGSPTVRVNGVDIEANPPTSFGLT